MLVPEQVQEPVDERLPPRLPHHLRAENRVSELAWHSGRQTPSPIDREGEYVGWLIDPQVLVLERPDLVGPDEDEAELALLDALGREHLASERARTVGVDGDAAAIRDLDRDHVPICSARCRSPPRAAGRPRRSAARACDGPRPRARSERKRRRPASRGCPAP